LIALTLAVLLGFAGMGVDVGYWEYQQREQQSATDAAALGGAQQLGYASCPDAAVAQSGAATDATANGFTDGTNGVQVQIKNPPSSGPYAGDDCAVYARITRPGIPAFFSKFFGTGSVKETTEAVARVSYDNPGCLYLLDQNATLNLNGDVMLAPKCAIYANSAAVETLASVFTVKDFGYAHGMQENLVSLFLGAQPKQMIPVADPCPEITACAYLAGNPPAETGCHSFVNVSVLPVTVYPGCYSDFENLLGVVNMTSGLYTFTGPVSNTGVLTGDNVTMYVDQSGGPVQLNGSVVLISPQTSGPYAGVLLYQVPTNTNTVHFNASVNLSLAGLVYAPKSTGEVLGMANVTFGKYVLFVLSNIKMLVGATLTLPGPDTGQSLIKTAVLTE
jgi:hypothetical protein